MVYNVNEDELTISESYTYATDSVYGASGHVTRYTYNVGSQNSIHTYTYNEAGYITKIRYNTGGKTVTYTYDGMGQLIGEDNDITGYTYTYTYDAAGNLTRVSYVAQTNDGFIQMGIIGSDSAELNFAPLLPNLPAATTNTYTYTDTEWGDLLTKYNGVSITYDEIGNPLSYYNGSSYTFSWQGRRLMTATKGTNTMSFAYDSDGLRIAKTVNGVTTHYVYDGELLLAEYTDTTTVVYIYDANGSPIGFKCRLNTYEQDVWDIYWYGKNLQGDITAIYNSTGTELISYTYTAWGTTTITYSNGGASTTATYNNLTYRGYYYDSDLGMYYLQSRYYDPAICRFINADSLMAGVNNSTSGFNLYVYCFNNPIAFTDDSGNWPKIRDVIKAVKEVAKKVVDTIVEVCENIAEDVKNYDKDNKDTSLVAQSNYFSAYEGTFVVITPFKASFSFGFIGLSYKQKNEQTIKHEYGHKVQLDERGWGRYITEIAIPSLTANILHRRDKLIYDYYGSPWESEADIKGGVERKEGNTPWPSNSYNSYWDLIKMFFTER